jgi:hypothetical protein
MQINKIERLELESQIRAKLGMISQYCTQLTRFKGVDYLPEIQCQGPCLQPCLPAKLQNHGHQYTGPRAKRHPATHHGHPVLANTHSTTLRGLQVSMRIHGVGFRTEGIAVGEPADVWRVFEARLAILSHLQNRSMRAFSQDMPTGTQ